MILFSIIIASLFESLASFAGGFLVIFREGFARAFAHRALGFAIGALIGVSFFDIIPEAAEAIGNRSAFLFVAVGILLFFVLEKLLFWYHCHDGTCAVHTFTHLILLGDAVHNAVDGVMIGLSFLAGIPLGIATTMAVIFHEIPQEIADFGVLMAGGYSRMKALWYNFLISLTTIAGALFAYVFGSALEGVLPYALALIGGNFLYIALTDLMPEVHEETRPRHMAEQLALVIAGAALMFWLGGE